MKAEGFAEAYYLTEREFKCLSVALGNEALYGVFREDERGYNRQQVLSDLASLTANGQLISDGEQFRLNPEIRSLLTDISESSVFLAVYTENAFRFSAYVGADAVLIEHVGTIHNRLRLSRWSVDELIEKVLDVADLPASDCAGSDSSLAEALWQVRRDDVLRVKFLRDNDDAGEISVGVRLPDSWILAFDGSEQPYQPDLLKTVLEGKLSIA